MRCWLHEVASERLLKYDHGGSQASTLAIEYLLDVLLRTTSRVLGVVTLRAEAVRTDAGTEFKINKITPHIPRGFFRFLLDYTILPELDTYQHSMHLTKI